MVAPLAFISSTEVLKLDDWDEGSEVVAVEATPDVEGCGELDGPIS